MISKRATKSAMESMLFVWGELLPIKIIGEIFNMDWQVAYEYMKELQDEYKRQGRGILIMEINKSFAFATVPENAHYIEMLCNPAKEKKLSQSALEVLAIIAYKQPVTKGEIESIRGIKCTRVMEGLQNKGLIEAVGRSEAIGRPILYGTANAFLKHFGFESLKELPDIEDIDGIGMDEEETYDDGAEQLTLLIEKDKKGERYENK